MRKLICIKCAQAEFLDPKKEICYKTGGLFCKRLQIIVGKYDLCHIKGRSTDKCAGIGNKVKKKPEERR